MSVSHHHAIPLILVLGLALGAPIGAVDDGAYLDHEVVPIDEGGSNRDHANAIAVQPDGKILLLGTASIATTTVAVLTRQLPGGGGDPAFGGGTGKVINPCSLFIGSRASAIHLLANGKILLAGTLVAEPSGDFLVWRLHPDGTCDLTFGNFGIQLIPFDRGGDNRDDAYAIAVDGLGRIVVAGSVDFPGDDGDFGVARLTADGALDTSFSGDGKVTISFDLGGFTDDFATGVAIDRDGRILVGGAAFNGTGGSYDFAISRLLDNGGLDSTFGAVGKLTIGYNLGGSGSEILNAIAVWPDGEIVAAGSTETGPNTLEWAVLRIAPNGTQVLGLHRGYFGFTSPAIARAMVLQPDGKIVIAGLGQGVANSDFGIARLLRNGSPDPSFPFGTGVTSFDFNWGPGSHTDIGRAVTLDHDGRILVAGWVEFNDPDLDFGWLRLDSSYVFADGFEWGDPTAWSDTVP